MLGILCHNARYGCCLWIKHLVDDSDKDVPLGKDAEQSALVDHWQCADLKLTHHAYRHGNGIRRRYRVHGLVLLDRQHFTELT